MLRLGSLSLIDCEGILLTHGACRTGCTLLPGSDPAPSTHGWYCNDCHARALRALKAAGPLVEHLLALPPLRAKSGTERANAAQWEAPLPFNITAFDDANWVYAQLATWCHALAVPLRRSAPVPAVHAWQTARDGIIGLPDQVTPNAGRYAVSIMATWLQANLDEILDTAVTAPEFLAMLGIGNLDLAPRVYADDEDLEGKPVTLPGIAARWPLNDRPTYSKTALCPDDAGRLLIQPPRHHGDDRLIICGTCGRTYTDQEHDQFGAVLAAFTRAEQTANAIARRLTRRYGNVA